MTDQTSLLEQSLRLAAAGELEGALEQAKAAAGADPRSPEAHEQVGSLLTLLGRPLEAAKSLQAAIMLAPQRPAALNSFGALLRTLGREREAQKYFEWALDRDPAFHEALVNVLAVYHTQDDCATAISRLYAAIGAGNQRAETWLRLGGFQLRSGRETEALHSFERAIELDPASADAWVQLADTQLTLGKMAEARNSLLRAIELDPGRAEFYRVLATTMPDAVTPGHRAALERLLSTGDSPRQRIAAHFALANVEQRASSWNAAFDHFAAGNALIRTLVPYDEAAVLERFAEIASVFSKEMIERGGIGYHASELPVFIFGMPRSGTTLVEQIVASHPLAFAAGELPILSEIVLKELATPGPVHAKLAVRYDDALRSLAPPMAARVTDKMPSNFLYAGLIRMLFPFARMIHVRRDPLDTCWSCFSTHFSEPELVWSSDFGTLARYYRAYETLMEHWRQVLPAGSMLEVRYEDLVADFEPQARRIIEYCGLDWDERCLEFHKTERPVQTASLAQVRRPLYSTSVGRSRAYGELLRPLADALDVEL